jgi:uncharacterized protein
VKVFLDTSAIYALLDRRDRNHVLADELWRLVMTEHSPITSNYVLLESCALVQSRLGMAPAGEITNRIQPAAAVVWVDERLHELGASAMLGSGRRGLSLVDCVSFEIMRRHAIPSALSFDKHFTERGYPLPVLPTE